MYDAEKRGLKAHLRQLTKIFSRRTAVALPLQRLIEKSKTLIFLPFYHIVRDEACPYIDPLYTIRSSTQFQKDLDFLLKYYEPIDLAQLLKIKQGEVAKPLKPVMHLSFDDGLRECAEIIAPILKKKGISASFFINPAFMDNKGLMFRYKSALISTHLQTLPKNEAIQLLAKDEITEVSTILELGHQHQELLDRLALRLGLDFNAVLQAHQPYMSRSQIQDLLDQGFSIGSHSIDHPLYKKISIEEQWRQTIEGQKQLETQFELPYRIFAFPFTDDGVSQAFFDRLFQEEGFDLTFGGAGVKQDVVEQNLQRFPMESDCLDSAEQMLKTEYFYALLKRLVNKNTIHRS